MGDQIHLKIRNSINTWITYRKFHDFVNYSPPPPPHTHTHILQNIMYICEHKKEKKN